MSTEEAKKIVDRIADFGATFFGVTGGQPFLRKDLFEVLDYATEKGLSLFNMRKRFFCYLTLHIIYPDSMGPLTKQNS